VLCTAAGGLGWICGQQDTTLTMALVSGACVFIAVDVLIHVTH
jgi:hypothetical protein